MRCAIPSSSSLSCAVRAVGCVDVDLLVTKKLPFDTKLALVEFDAVVGVVLVVVFDVVALVSALVDFETIVVVVVVAVVVVGLLTVVVAADAVVVIIVVVVVVVVAADVLCVSFLNAVVVPVVKVDATTAQLRRASSATGTRAQRL